MALTRVKTWGDEYLTYADLNAEFDNILNNALSLVSPLTGSLDCNGQSIILDPDGDTSVSSSSDDSIVLTIGGVATYTIDASIFDFNGKRLDLDADNDSSFRITSDDVLALELQGVDAFIFDGDEASIVNGLTFTASATGSAVSIAAQGTDTDIDLTLSSKGAGEINLTGDLWSGAYSPDLQFGGANTGMTYGTQTGTWVRAGNLVFVQIAITLTAKGSSTGVATVTLPVAANASVPAGFLTISYAENCSGFSHAAVAEVDSSASTASLWIWLGSGVGLTAASQTNFGDTSIIRLSGCYTV